MSPQRCPFTHLCPIKQPNLTLKTATDAESNGGALQNNPFMKNLVRLSALSAALFMAASNDSSAQATASASAQAIIVTPISISKTADMHFGNVAVSAANNGTVELTPGGTRNATGGVTLPATIGSPAAASFTVSGEANYTYAISLPTSTITLTNPNNSSMLAGVFTSSPNSTGTLSASGSQTLTVGATLQVNAGQQAGTYSTTTDFAVTVNYN